MSFWENWTLINRSYSRELPAAKIALSKPYWTIFYTSAKTLITLIKNNLASAYLLYLSTSQLSCQHQPPKRVPHPNSIRIKCLKANYRTFANRFCSKARPLLVALLNNQNSANASKQPTISTPRERKTHRHRLMETLPWLNCSVTVWLSRASYAPLRSREKRKQLTIMLLLRLRENGLIVIWNICKAPPNNSQSRSMT